MIYSGDSDGQDLCTLTDDMVNTTVITYPLQAKTRAANKTLRKVWSWIFSAYGGWQFDDSNNTTTLPIATTTLTVGQLDYDIPSGALTVRGVEILPSGSTVYQRVEEVTEEEIIQAGRTDASLFTSTGVPVYYRPIGNSIKLYPAPNYTIANGLRLTFDSGVISFASTDTTKQPGFVSQFHEVVSVGMALEYARRNNLDSFNFLETDMNRFELDIKDYYSSRYKERFPSKIKTRDLTNNYI